MNILEEANKIVKEAEEHMDIAGMIEDRNNNDDGTRFSLNEVKDILKRERK